jgi:hypothetical protein
MTTEDEVERVAKTAFDLDNEDIQLTWDQAFPFERYKYRQHARRALELVRTAGFVVTRAAS